MSARVAAVDIASRSGSTKESQDRVFTMPNAIAVLDGASSAKPQYGDGGWYAETLGTALVRYLAAAPDGPLSSALAAAIVKLNSAEDLHGDAPSSTVVIARWVDDRLDVLVLGDSTVAVFMHDGGVAVLCDDRLDDVGPEERRAYQSQLRAGAGFGDRHRENLRNLQAVQRTWRNRLGGYWIAETDPTAATQAITRSWPLADVSAVMLATDGVTDGITRYGVCDWIQARTIVERDGAEKLIGLVHEAETGDPEGRVWPRGKRHDDKAIALVTFDQSRR